MPKRQEYNYFSLREVQALVDEFGLVPEVLITDAILKLVQHQLNQRRLCQIMTEEDERMSHQFLEYVMSRNRSRNSLPDVHDASMQGKFRFENFD